MTHLIATKPNAVWSGVAQHLLAWFASFSQAFVELFSSSQDGSRSSVLRLGIIRLTGRLQRSSSTHLQKVSRERVRWPLTQIRSFLRFFLCLFGSTFLFYFYDLKTRQINAKTTTQPAKSSQPLPTAVFGKLNIAGGSTGESEHKITLIVDETRFLIDIALLTQFPNTLLGRMFSSQIEWQVPNDRGEFSVAEGISSHVFRAILDYYKTGLIKCPSGVSVQELREACDYLLIPFDAQTVRCQNLRGLLHELSNEGARIQFENFLEELLMPLMLNSVSFWAEKCEIGFCGELWLIEIWDNFCMVNYVLNYSEL